MQITEPDFETKVYGDYYKGLVGIVYSKETRREWREQDAAATRQFLADAKAYLIESGVPEQYALNCVTLAWNQGHSSGFTEVYLHLNDLIEVFN